MGQWPTPSLGISTELCYLEEINPAVPWHPVHKWQIQNTGNTSCHKIDVQSLCPCCCGVSTPGYYGGNCLYYQINSSQCTTCILATKSVSFAKICVPRIKYCMHNLWKVTWAVWVTWVLIRKYIQMYTSCNGLTECLKNKFVFGWQATTYITSIYFSENISISSKWIRLSFFDNLTLKTKDP